MISFPDHYGEFLRQLGEKLARGQKEYGSGSFYRPEVEILEELQAEALDLAGWGYVLWTKIEAAKRRVPGVRSYVYEWGEGYETGKTVSELKEGEK